MECCCLQKTMSPWERGGGWLIGGSTEKAFLAHPKAGAILRAQRGALIWSCQLPHSSGEESVLPQLGMGRPESCLVPCRGLPSA